MSTETAEFTWNPPQFDISRPPNLSSTAELYPDSEFPSNFIRTAKWSPDGANVLAQCENRSFQLFDLHHAPEGEGSTASLTHSRTLDQPSAILDFAWYPSASSKDSASYCFVASVRECPVKLLDASDGRLRASYKIVDHRERQVAPHSMAFNLTAEKLYCGFEDAIEVFDIHRPGEGIRLPTTPSKKTKEGLKGIIASLAFSPNYDFYAAGTLAPSSLFAPNIALFSEADQNPIMYVGADVQASVTQLMFNPTKPHILYAAFRRHTSIYAWDLRGDASTPVRILQNTKSSAHDLTNQKLRFDIDLGGKRLGVGDQEGNVSFFDLDAEPEVEAIYEESIQENPPTLTYKSHQDAVGSVSFHPFQPLVLSASGSRHFLHEDTGASSSESDSDDDQSECIVKTAKYRPQPVAKESSLKIWSLGNG